MIRIILGAPCAGKTTYISEHAAPGDITIDFDRLAAALTPNGELGVHLDRPETVRRAASYTRKALAAFLRDKANETTEASTVWIPITSLEAFNGAIDKYVTAGARITQLTTPKAECIRRAKVENRPPSTIQAINEYYENLPTVPDGWQYQERAQDMKAKTTDIQVKAMGGEKTATTYPEWALKNGDFVAYASTFNDEPDAVGDIVAPGAFTDSLAEWKSKSTPIPLLFGHRMDDPAFNIGEIVDAKEDEHGLLVWGRLDLDCEKGRDCHRLLKARRLTQLSFAYDIKDAHRLPRDVGDGLLLKALDLHEVSLVPLGANRHTSVLAVKAAVDAAASTAGTFTKDEQETLESAASDFQAALDKLEQLIENTEPQDQGTELEPIAPAPSEGEEQEKEDDEPAGDEAATASPDERTPTEEPGGLPESEKAAAELELSLALAHANLDERSHE